MNAPANRKPITLFQVNGNGSGVRPPGEVAMNRLIIGNTDFDSFILAICDGAKNSQQNTEQDAYNQDSDFNGSVAFHIVTILPPFLVLSRGWDRKAEIRQ